MSEAPETEGGFRLWMLLPVAGAAAVLAVFLLGLGREDGGRNLPSTLIGKPAPEFTLPPLRERVDDIDVLAEHFATTLATRYALPVPALSNEVREMLRGHTWPGNVRELRHAVERALLLSEPGTLDPEHLISRARPAREGGAIPFPATLYEIQVAAVRAALAQHGDNKSAAARQLGISRSRLQRLLERGEDEA